jgi:hypothetical protein
MVSIFDIEPGCRDKIRKPGNGPDPDQIWIGYSRGTCCTDGAGEDVDEQERGCGDSLHVSRSMNVGYFVGRNPRQ